MTTTNRVPVYMSKAHVRSNQSQTKAANKTPGPPVHGRRGRTLAARPRPHARRTPAHGHIELKYPVHPSSVKYNT